MKKIIFITAFFCVNTFSLLACVCVQDTSKDPVGNALKKADMVFSGKVISAEFRQGYTSRFIEEEILRTGKKVDYQVWVLTFQVERLWKGKKTAELILVTHETKTESGIKGIRSCDYYFDEGEQYLVYAYEEKGYLRTNSCTRTQTLSKATKDLKRLGRGKRVAVNPIR